MSALSSPDTAKGQLQRIALDYLHEKEAAGEIPTSIRFVFYELEQRGLQSKAQTSKRKPAQNLTDAITVLREVGLTKRPVVISEAKTVGGVLARGLAPRYVVAVASTTGQCRGFLETEVARLLSDPFTRVLYLGDADDAGDDIEENTRRVLERATDRAFDADTWARLAITDDQAQELRRRGVPPIHKTDRRYRDGNPHEAFECEALGQRAIERIVRDRLDALLPEPIEDILERERQQRAAVRRLLGEVGT